MYIHVNGNRRSDQGINRSKLQMDWRVGIFHFWGGRGGHDALSVLTHRMKTRQLKTARVEMRYERNLFAVLYAPELSGSLFYLTNDSLAPLSPPPPPLPLVLSISSTFLPSHLSLSLWARCPSPPPLPIIFPLASRQTFVMKIFN